MFYFERLVYLWSGWLQRASFSVFTPSRVMSGPTESYCGRSSLWVTMATRDILTVIMTNIDYWLWLNFWVEFLSLSSGVNVVWSLQTTVFMSFSASCDIRIGQNNLWIHKWSAQQQSLKLDWMLLTAMHSRTCHWCLLPLCVCLPIQVRAPTQTLLWIPTFTRWSKMAATWISQTSLQQRCENTDRHFLNGNKVLMNLIDTFPLRYQLMTHCWSLEPTDRPTFKVIAQLINRLLPSTGDTSPYHGDQVRMNQTPVVWVGPSAPSDRLIT